MGTPSYMQSVVDRNFVMWRLPVLIEEREGDWLLLFLSSLTHPSTHTLAHSNTHYLITSFACLLNYSTV